MHKGKSVLLARKLAVTLGKQLQDPQYHVASGYTHGYSHANLADTLIKLPEFKDTKKRILMHGIRCALVGNDDEALGEVYKGVLNEELYREHAAKHVSATSKSNTTLQKEQRKGIYGLDTTKLQENALKSVAERGLFPWSREELSKVLGLALLGIFKTERGIDYNSIAHQLNSTLYGGRDIRTGHAVKGAINRIKGFYENAAA